MSTFTFLSAVALMVLAFASCVSAGATRDMDGFGVVTTLTALLVAAIFLILQALLWISFGMHVGD